LFALLAEVETDMTIFYRKLAQLDIEAKVDDMTDELLLITLQEAWYRLDALTESYKLRLLQWLRKYILRLQSGGVKQADKIQIMNASNPKYVLRNYLSQQAIDKAEQGDYAMLNELLDVMRHPYDEQIDKDKYAVKRPEWARNKAGCSKLSCSS